MPCCTFEHVPTTDEKDFLPLFCLKHHSFWWGQSGKAFSSWKGRGRQDRSWHLLACNANVVMMSHLLLGVIRPFTLASPSSPVPSRCPRPSALPSRAIPRAGTHRAAGSPGVRRAPRRDGDGDGDPQRCWGGSGVQRGRLDTIPKHSYKLPLVCKEKGPQEHGEWHLRYLTPHLKPWMMRSSPVLLHGGAAAFRGSRQDQTGAGGRLESSTQLQQRTEAGPSLPAFLAFFVSSTAFHLICCFSSPPLL